MKLFLVCLASLTAQWEDEPHPRQNSGWLVFCYTTQTWHLTSLIPTTSTTIPSVITIAAEPDLILLKEIRSLFAFQIDHSGDSKKLSREAIIQMINDENAETERRKQHYEIVGDGMERTWGSAARQRGFKALGIDGGSICQAGNPGSNHILERR